MFETIVKISESVFGKEELSQSPLAIKAAKSVKLSVQFLDSGEAVSVVLWKEGEEEMSYLLGRGDTLTLDHKFKVEGTRVVEADHPFPIELEFNDQIYKLNKTKNGKLILTK